MTWVPRTGPSGRLANATKPGTATLPFFGVDAAVLDEADGLLDGDLDLGLVGAIDCDRPSPSQKCGQQDAHERD